MSCSSAAGCVANGVTVPELVIAALIESWNGATWSMMKPAAAGSLSAVLTGVSCASAKS